MPLHRKGVLPLRAVVRARSGRGKLSPPLIDQLGITLRLGGYGHAEGLAGISDLAVSLAPLTLVTLGAALGCLKTRQLLATQAITPLLQPLDCRPGGQERLFECLLLSLFASQLGFEGVPTPVSYTHLDVYKRQYSESFITVSYRPGVA